MCGHGESPRSLFAADLTWELNKQNANKRLMLKFLHFYIFTFFLLFFLADKFGWWYKAKIFSIKRGNST